jgi:hypothetical protein
MDLTLFDIYDTNLTYPVTVFFDHSTIANTHILRYFSPTVFTLVIAILLLFSWKVNNAEHSNQLVSAIHNIMSQQELVLIAIRDEMMGDEIESMAIHERMNAQEYRLFSMRDTMEKQELWFSRMNDKLNRQELKSLAIHQRMSEQEYKTYVYQTKEQDREQIYAEQSRICAEIANEIPDIIVKLNELNNQTNFDKRNKRNDEHVWIELVNV